WRTRPVINITEHRFDVALSFPGEHRTYVERVAVNLEDVLGPNSVFYDNFYRSQLARPSLDTMLQNLYAKQSGLIVVFLGADYQRKDWCGLEFRAIREKIMAREHERVMLVRMDDGDVDGIFRTDGYIDGRNDSSSEV